MDNAFVNFIQETNPIILMVIGFALGCLLGELDWRFNPFWDGIRPKKKNNKN
jgi:hypothetical protein